MSDAKQLKRVLARLDSARTEALDHLTPDHLDDSTLERLARIQLAILAIRDVLDGERKRREFEEWLERSDHE
ncbi:MAG: hypothetical protein PVI15_01625 [Chromatiales bacterium]|jgi:hypothetical protein